MTRCIATKLWSFVSSWRRQKNQSLTVAVEPASLDRYATDSILVRNEGRERPGASRVARARCPELCKTSLTACPGPTGSCCTGPEPPPPCEVIITIYPMQCCTYRSVHTFHPLIMRNVTEDLICLPVHSNVCHHLHPVYGSVLKTGSG